MMLATDRFLGAPGRTTTSCSCSRSLLARVPAGGLRPTTCITSTRMILNTTQTRRYRSLLFRSSRPGNGKVSSKPLPDSQAYYFFPLLLLEGIGTRVASVQFLMTGKPRYLIAESLGMAAHLVLYSFLIFSLMPLGQALLFVLVHQCLSGLYIGSVFAPNHKGMLVPTAAQSSRFPPSSGAIQSKHPTSSPG